MVNTQQARRERIGELGFDPLAQPCRRVTACDLCGAGDFVTVTHSDRYGFPITADACSTCGLVFLNPVMTADAYGRFYEMVYRPLLTAFFGRQIDAQSIQTEQAEYANRLSQLLQPFIAGGKYKTHLDIGGSTGVVASTLQSKFGLESAVLDPAPDELAVAEEYGLETITGLLEEYEPQGRTFDLVTICQTADHLLNVAGALEKSRQLLARGGILFIDIVDLRAGYLRNQSVESAIKVDHPYYFTEPTMEAYLARAGLQPLKKNYEVDHLHIGYVCSSTHPRPDATPSTQSVEFLLREIRSVQNMPRSVRP